MAGMADIRQAIDKEPPTPMQEVDKAFETCKFGRFHVKLVFINFFGCVACVLVTNTTSYLLPSAECDLNMNLKQKGVLTSMPYFGMIVTSLITGFLVDAFGRIMFIRISFGGLFVCSVFSACSQNFEMLATAKFLEGILFATAINALTVMVAEFCHSSVRDRIMLSQSSYAAVAQIISPAMAWAILVQDWRISLFDGNFVLNTWNFYLLAMSLWSFAASILYFFVPESPKYLVSQERYAEAKKIVVQMYAENTGLPPKTFPYPDLWEKQISELKIKHEETKITSGQKLLTGFKNLNQILKRPVLKYLIIIAAMQFIILGMYNVLRLWFPQLSTIVEHQILDKDQNLCSLLDVYTANLKNKSNVTSEACVPSVSGSETYINSIIIGCVCLLPYFISGILVNKIGKKILMIIGASITSVTLMGLQYANSRTLMVTLFAISIALMQTMKSLGLVSLVEIFPTGMRSITMATVSLMARFGTMTGNVGFPILLGYSCAIPFYTMTALMISCIFFALLLPRK